MFTKKKALHIITEYATPSRL